MLYFTKILGLASTQQITKTKLSYPLSLTEVKRHLRVDMDFVDDDDYIEGLIESGTQICENYIGKSIAQTRNVLRIDDFDTDWLKIYEGNFISIESVKNNAGTDLGTIHQTTKKDDFFEIEWVNAVASDPITITFLTGYNTNETPKIIKQSILIAIADLYDSQRSSYTYARYDEKILGRMLDYYKALQN